MYQLLRVAVIFSGTVALMALFQWALNRSGLGHNSTAMLLAGLLSIAGAAIALERSRPRRRAR